MNRFTLDGASTRDVQAINKMVSGMIKLVYPDGNLTDKELEEILKLSIEYRQFVIDQNYRINREESFNKVLSYTIY